MTSQNDNDNQKWYNKLLEKVKSYQKQVDELEDSVFDVRKKYEEVVARNLFLEQEIEDRTQELDRAQKSLLTLQHIWDTMRSAEPLGKVLSIVGESLIQNLDYEFCCVMQIKQTGSVPTLQTRSYTENEYLKKLDAALEEPLTSFFIPVKDARNPVAVALQDNEIVVIDTFQKLLDMTVPEIDPVRIKDLDVLLADKVIIVLPLIVEDEKFGVLYTISKRSECSESEKKFLRMFADQIELAVIITKLFEQVREQAITDGLTQISNRRHFDQCLAQEVERSLRLKQPFTLITLDMDHLKLINDTHGHSAGDAAIVHLADVLKENARAIDLPARFGGEEFAVLLPGVDIEGGIIAAERIRTAIISKEVEGVGIVTASIGVATFLRHTDNLGELLEIADEAMYEAKQTGRNKVCVAKTPFREVSWQEIALDTFIKVLTQKHSPITPELARELSGKLKETLQKEDSFVDILYNTVDTLISTVDTSYEQGYSETLVNLAVKLAEKAGLSQLEVDQVRLAALLHDLGKATMPQQIISKPGPLDEEEWNVILQHPIVAARKMLGPLHSLDHVIPIVEHSHEHWDGSGYPSQLAGENIPVGARIILIVDSYCAMTTHKPYRHALTRKQAIETLRKGENVTWDKNLVEMFIELLEEENI
jgi:diguanylate cyclase (GGDEF)-like protein